MPSNSESPSSKVLIVTIDGPAGAGKSTVAKKLAKSLGLAYLDTGAMYRALTLKALKKNLNFEDEEKCISLAKETMIDLDDQTGGLKVFLDGEDVSEEIRSLEVTNNTFYIARIPGVREVMVHLQRSIGEKRGAVIEGRDVGTVVFPNASKKFYLDADFNERSGRRINELKEKGQSVDEQTLTSELQDRDHKDLTRDVGPLKKADDAILIDSTRLTVDEVVEKMFKAIKKDG